MHKTIGTNYATILGNFRKHTDTIICATGSINDPHVLINLGFSSGQWKLKQELKPNFQSPCKAIIIHHIKKNHWVQLLHILLYICSLSFASQGLYICTSIRLKFHFWSVQFHLLYDVLWVKHVNLKSSHTIRRTCHFPSELIKAKEECLQILDETGFITF